MLLIVSAVMAQKQWTLQECLDYAMANNITLKKQQLRQQTAMEELKGAKGALLPSVTASTNQSLGYQPWKDSGISTVTNGVVNTKVDKSYYNGSYSVNAQWTVWNGGRNWNTVKLDKLSEQQAELSAQETANSIQESIAQLYSQILYLTENVKVNEKMLETSKKNEERGQEMVNVGKMSKADLAQLTSQRANDEYSIVESKTSLMNYKLQLKQLLEITDEQDFDVALVSVTERTKEIGLRMAVGATGPVISLQFLIESVLISVTGGLIGVLVGVGASSAVSAIGMPSSVPAWSIYVSFLVCVFIGVLFGYIPAQKAANMDPIEAIRHE